MVVHDADDVCHGASRRCAASAWRRAARRPARPPAHGTRSRAARSVLIEVVRELDDAGVAIDDIGLRRPTLDDVFLSLTGHAAEDGEDGDDEAATGDSRPRRRRTVMAAATTMTPGARAAVQPGARHRRRRWPSPSATCCAIPRVPELLVFATIQPIMFVLLFAFVFGGAIPLPGGGSYREFLMAGHLHPDRRVRDRRPRPSAWPRTCTRGIIDRFRSLPMARSAVLVGRTISDLSTTTSSSS